MASDISLYLANKFLRWLAGNAMPTEPASVYVGLFNGDPKGAGVEVTTDIDATGRKAISFAALASGTGNTLTSDADVDFGTSDSDVANLDYVGVFDASSAGNLLWAKVLPGGPFAITTGAAVKFPSGDISFTQGS